MSGKKIIVWSPKGERQEHTSVNARELVDLAGWSYEEPTPEYVAAKTEAEEARKNNAAREDGLVPLWSPEGKLEYHTPRNARDLTAHAKWRIIPPVKRAGVAQEMPEVKTPEEIETPASDDEPEAQEDTMGHDARVSLLEHARMLGIKVDSRWGVSRLKREIAMAEKPTAEESE